MLLALLRRSCLLILLFSGITMFSYAGEPADTLRLSLKDVEKQFLEKNLNLLAQHYNIEAQKALVQQARLWDNPELSTNQNVYSNHRWFEHGVNPDGTPYGQYAIEINQLIKTANKRGRLIAIAKTNVTLSEWQFKDVMRNLKYQLRQDYYTLAGLLQKQSIYQEQATQINTLLGGVEKMYQLGNISNKDRLRIKAMALAIQNSITDNSIAINDLQSELKTMLHLSGNIFIQPVPDAGNKAIHVPPLQSLLDTAYTYNSAYVLQGLQVTLSNKQLHYEKAMAYPDLSVGPNYDHNSDYTPRYFGFSVNLPIPVFNRNQGQIKAATWQVKQEEVQLQQLQVKLGNDIQGSLKKYLQIQQLLSAGNEFFYKDYKIQYDNIFKSYQQRQISLIDFIDYFQDYRETMENKLDMDLKLQLAKEDINYQVGKDL